MNGPIRQGMHPAGGIGQTPNNMLAIGNTSFMQNPAHMGQPSLAQGMGVSQNMNPSNPPMGILTGGPVPPSVPPRYAMQPNMLQHQPQQQRPTILRQGQNPPQLNSAANPSQPHMPNQLQSIHFPGGMMQQPPGANNSVRRVNSQPLINPLTGHPAGHPGMPTSAGGNLGMQMSMSMQPNMPAQMCQPQHPNPQNVHMQHQQQALMQAEIRNQPLNQGMPQGMARTPSQGQVMNSLSQPPIIGSMSHPSGMQPPHLQNTFTNGGPMPSQHPPPQLSSSPRPTQNPANMSMGTPGPSHTPVNRARMTPDNTFIGYPGSQFASNPNRLPNAGQAAYPSFVPSSTPPMPMDISQSSPGMHSQGTPNRSFSTQPMDMMTSNLDIYSSSFGMPPPPSVPHPRPPSHTNPHPSPQQPQPPQHQTQQQPQSHHQSPPHRDQTNSHPQRPQSQPQQGPGRPPSQTGTTRTPRSAQMSLPSGGLPGPLTATGRLPNAQQAPGQPVPSMPPIAPRPPNLISGVPPPPTPINSSVPMAGDVTPSATASIQRTATGTSSGLIRLLQFSGVLSGDSHKKFQLHFWNDLVREYFTPKAVMKLTLWRDNLRTEAKPFEIGVPILPRFFLVTTQSGVKSMTLSLDGARERAFNPAIPGHTVVECISAIWTYKYSNGYTVMLKGPLTVHAILTQITPPGNQQAPQFTLRFEDFHFDANTHEKYISLDHILGSRAIETPRPPNFPASMTGLTSQAQMQQHQIEEDKRCEEPRVLIDHGSIPGEPVNAFGIPQATMRCLELAESVGSMADLIAFAKDSNLGPLDALKSYASKIRESMSMGPIQQPINPLPQNNNNNTSLGPPWSNYPPPSSIGHTPAVTLYSSAPASVTNPQPNPPSSMNSPQNTSSSSSVNSPEKQPKTIPQQQQQQQQAQTPSQSGPASSPAVSSGGTTNNTPAMANTSLKRKQAGDATSPTVGNSEQQPAKRVPRKKGRTGTG